MNFSSKLKNLGHSSVSETQKQIGARKISATTYPRCIDIRVNFLIIAVRLIIVTSLEAVRSDVN